MHERPYYIKLRNTGAFAQNADLQIWVGSHLNLFVEGRNVLELPTATIAWQLKSISFRMI
jgi:hypothetical protein